MQRDAVPELWALLSFEASPAARNSTRLALIWRSDRLVPARPFADRCRTRLHAHPDRTPYQVLTKRAGRLQSLLSTALSSLAKSENIWWGVSVENRRHGLPRIGQLRATPATVRFLSIEPLLEDLGVIDLSGIDWVIVGGESGAGARPMQESWVLSIRDQCQLAGVPFFFKQWGGVRKSKTGRTLAGRLYNEFPAIVRQPVMDAAARSDAISEIEARHGLGENIHASEIETAGNKPITALIPE